MAKKVASHPTDKRQKSKFTLPKSASTLKMILDGHSVGPKVLKRNEQADYQVINVVTGHYIKRSASTGQFKVKKDGSPFANVHVQERTPQAAPNPAIDRDTANWAEDAVISYLNKHSVN